VRGVPFRGSFGVAITLHVLTAIFIIGPLAASTATAPRLVRLGPDGLVGLRGAVRAVRYLSLGSIVTAGLGFSLVHKGSFGSVRSLSDTWLTWSLVLWVVAVLVNLAVVAPALERAARDIARHGDGRRHLPTVALGGGLTTLCWIVIVILMMEKPGT
jgi:hypothetical protein